MKPILHTLSGGPSEHGLSKYLNKLGCATRERLTTLQRSEPGGEEALFRKKSALLTGIIGHAMMEHYWNAVLATFPQDPDLPVIEFQELVDETSQSEAERCVKALIAYMGPGQALGKVLSVEEDLATEWTCDDEVGYAVPRQVPLTGRLDLCTKVSKTDATRIAVQFDMDGATGLWGPGTWIWDYKFRGQRSANLMDKALEAWQYVAYPWMYNMLHMLTLGKRVRGTINLSIFTTKQVGFKLTVVPPPNQKQIEALKRLVTTAYLTDPMSCRPLDSECFSWGRVCQFLHNGCERGVEV